MEKTRTYRGAGVSLAILALALGSLSQEPGIGNAESKPSRPCPHLVELDAQHQIEIVRMHFTDRIETLLGTAEIPQEARDTYRFAVVTLKITKPAGESLTLAAADLTLHYYHGSGTDVAPCEGLSWFKSEADLPVPVLMHPLSGPGFIKQTTSPGLAASTVIYIDAIFGSMESDTAECWICVGRPATTQPFVVPSPAWTNERSLLRLS